VVSPSAVVGTCSLTREFEPFVAGSFDDLSSVLNANTLTNGTTAGTSRKTEKMLSGARPWSSDVPVARAIAGGRAGINALLHHAPSEATTGPSK
jgi:hypothetical protein